MIKSVQEYLISDDHAEATRCLRELEVPHFHHELVYEVREHDQYFNRYPTRIPESQES